MAGKVLSIEIGQSFTRAIEVDYKSSKRPRIYKYFSFLTPDGMISDDVISEEQMEIFAGKLKAEMKESHISTTKVVFAINSGSIASREVEIPIVKENKIQNILAANSSEYFPVDLSRYQLTYRVAEKDDANKKLRLVAYAVPKRLVESYYALAKVCGLTIQSLDYVGNSIYQVMQRTMSPEFAVTLKVEETASLITIVKDGKVDLQRSIGYGIDEIVEAVKDSGYFGIDLSYAERIGIVGSETCIHNTLSGPEEADRTAAIERGTDEALLELRDNATDALRYLIGNITRALDYYTSRNSEFQMKEITLLGIGAYCKGVDDLLAHELGAKVTTITAFEDARPAGKPGEREFAPVEFMACIGASINPLEITLEATKKSDNESNSESMLVPSIVFIVGMLVAVLLVAIPLVQNLILKGEKQDLENRLVELEPAQEAYDTYQLAYAEYTDVLAMDAMTDTENDVLLDFLKEFEENCPSNILLDNLSSGTSGITLTLEADKKEEIAELITQMRQFESISAVETAGFSEEQSDTGLKRYVCTLICAYAMSDETTDAAETAGIADAAETTGTDAAADTDNADAAE